MIALPTDAEIAALVNGIYAYDGYAPIAWDHFEDPAEDDGICWALKRLGAIDVVILRGSTDLEDWLRNAEALADPLLPEEVIGEQLLLRIGFQLVSEAQDHAFLGPVHPGFLAGMDAAYQVMKPLLRGQVIVAGHSLGAGRATILTGLMVHDGCAPLRRICFGEPRSGFQPLADLIADVPAVSYRNGNGIIDDLVTAVPFAIGPEAYVHCCPLTDVTADPTGSMFEKWGPIAWHGMPLYNQALQRKFGFPSALPAEMLLHAPVAGMKTRAPIH